MASKKPTKSPEDFDPMEQAITDFLQRVEGSEGCTVRVARRQALGKSWGTLCEYPADQFDVMDLAHDHGGGSYRLQLIDGRTKQIVNSITHEIDKAVRPSRRAPSISAATAGLGEMPDDPQQALSLMRLQLQMEANQRQMEMLVQMHQQRPADSLGMKDIVQLIAVMQGNGLKLSDIVPLLASKGSVMETIQAMQAMREMLPEGGGGTDWAGLAQSVLSALPQLQAPAPAAQLPPGATPARPATRNATANAAGPGEKRNATAGAGDDRQEALRAVVGLIKLGAKAANADPEDYASVLWDAMEAAGIKVDEMLATETPELLHRLGEVLPAIKGTEAFAGRIIDAMRSMLDDDDNQGGTDDAGSAQQAA